MRKFYALSVLAIGLSSGAMADEGQVVSKVPLLDTPTQQEQLAATLQAATAQQYHPLADIVHYMETNQAGCGNCADDDQEALLNYSRRFASAQYQWRDQGSVGVILRSGETSFGLWGDVREVNIVENEEVSLLPSGLSTSVTTVPAAVIASPGLAVSDSVGGGGGAAISDTPSPVSNRANLNVGNADASFNRGPSPTPSPATLAVLSPNGGNVRPTTGGTVSAGPRRIQSFSTTTSDLAYKEYMGGLFVSQSF